MRLFPLASKQPPSFLLLSQVSPQSSWSALRNWSSNTSQTTSSLPVYGMLFVDCRIQSQPLPLKLIGKLNTLGLSTTLSNWILDFLRSRPQTAGPGSHTSSKSETPRAVCSTPSCSHPWLNSQTSRELWCMQMKPPPLAAETNNNKSSYRNSCLLSQRSNRKHPDWKHHQLAWFEHGPGQEGSAVGK